MVLDLKVRNRGFPAQPIEIRICDAKDGQPFYQEVKPLLASDEDQLFHVHYRPNKEGDQQWKVEVKPLPGEHTIDNNHKIHSIRVRNNKLRVLYVESVPRWEYRKLKNFLTRGFQAFDAQVLLTDALFIQEASRGITRPSPMG